MLECSGLHHGDLGVGDLSFALDTTRSAWITSRKLPRDEPRLNLCHTTYTRCVACWEFDMGV